MYGTLDNEQTTTGGHETTTTAQGGAATPASRSPGRRRSSVGSTHSASERIYSHCHVQSGENEPGDRSKVDTNARKRLILASAVCLVFMVCEIAGGILSNSLAIATDAAHLLTDFASFLISLFAIWLATRPASKKMSFGWYRAEVIGALVSVLMIWLITGLLVYIAIDRLRTNKIEIDPSIMLITASAGLLVNILMAMTLHSHGHSHGHGHGHGHSHHDHATCGDEETHLDLTNGNQNGHHQHQNGSSTGNSNYHQAIQMSCENATLVGQRDADSKQRHLHNQKPMKRSENINVRAALVHVIGDFIQSLGVLVAAIVIYFRPDWAIIDPICTFFFSIIVLMTTLNVVRDAINVLMEGIPNGVNFHEVLAKLSQRQGILKVHNLRIWSLTMDKIAISTHIVIDKKQISQSEALDWAIDMLKRTYGFLEITIQVEEYRDEMRDCTHCKDEDVIAPAEQDSQQAS